MKHTVLLLVILSLSLARTQISRIETNILTPLAYNRNGNEFWSAGEWSNNSVHPLNESLDPSRYFHDPEAKRQLEHVTSRLTNLLLNIANSLTE